MNNLQIASLLTAIVFSAPVATDAATISFAGINLSSVSSASGQNFAYTVGSGPDTGTLNVRLISGIVGQLRVGSGPDANGFYALQDTSQRSVELFRFTFDVPRAFTINENELLTSLETNAFTLSSGTWTVLSSSTVVIGGSGSTISFRGTSPGVSAPYGDFSIAGVGSTFDYSITNTGGEPLYGSSLSMNVVPEPTSVALLLFGASFFFRRRTLRTHERSA